MTNDFTFNINDFEQEVLQSIDDINKGSDEGEISLPFGDMPPSPGIAGLFSL
jgi:hypothetical protein